jgi:hypothetical protein
MIRHLVWLPFVVIGCGEKSSKQPDKEAAAVTAVAPADATLAALPAAVSPLLVLLRGSQGINTDFQLVKVRGGAVTTVMKERVDGTKHNGSFDGLIVDPTKTRFMLSWLTSPGDLVPAIGGHGGELKTGAFYIGDADHGVTKALPVHKRVHAGEVFEVPSGFGPAEAYTELLERTRTFLRGREIGAGKADWMAVDDPKVSALAVSHDRTQLVFHDGTTFYVAKLAPKARVATASAKKLFTLPKGMRSGHSPILTAHEVIYVAENDASMYIEAFDLTTKTTARIHDFSDDLLTNVPRIYNEAQRVLFFGGGVDQPGNVYSYAFATKTKQKVDNAAVELLDVSLDGRHLLEARSENGFDRTLVVVDAITGQALGEVPFTGSDYIEGASVSDAVFLAK